MAMLAGPAFEVLTMRSSDAPQKRKPRKQPVGERRELAGDHGESEHDHDHACRNLQAAPGAREQSYAIQQLAHEECGSVPGSVLTGIGPYRQRPIRLQCI